MDGSLSKDKVITYNIMVNQNVKIHVHQEVELIYVLEGQMELKVEDDIFFLKEDDFVVVNANKKHSYKCSENIMMASFYISFQILSSFIGNNLILFWCNSTMDKDDSYEEVRKILKLIFNHHLNRKGEEDFYEYSLFYQLLNMLTNNFLINNADDRFHDKGSKYDDRINEITNYINGNYNKVISLNDLADQLHLSNAYLSRYFKKQLGINFIEHLNNVRLHYALEDLLYTDKTITRVALDNGFTITSVFNKLFKMTYDMTPSLYKKKAKENVYHMIEREEDKLHKQTILNRLDTYFEGNSIENQENTTKENKYLIVDANQSREYKRNWDKVINIGTASDLLHSDLQQHVVILKSILKFEYVRFWNIFGDDMYLDVSNQDMKYNFGKIDKILDFLIKHKIKPFIELGQKPKRINKTASEPIIFQDDLNIFSNISEWQNVLKAFTVHIIKRYTIEETQNWCFEMWKDKTSDYIDVDYLTIFDVGYTELKNNMPNCKVGGAGFCVDYGQKQLVENFTQWKNRKIQPDFLSIYLYPYLEGIEKGEKYSKRSTDKNFILNQIKYINEILKNIQWNINELYMTEWNNTISNRNYINDSCYKGAYVMQTIIDNVNEVDVIGYWIGSDLFSEFYDSSKLLNGGAGIISKDGIKKPAFYAIEFMNRMGKRLIDKGENYIVTTNGQNDYYIACNNYKHFNYYYYLKSEDEIKAIDQDKIFDNNESICLNFKIENVLNGQYDIKTYSVNRVNGSILDEWMKMDQREDLQEDEINYLKQISTPRLSMQQCKVDKEVLNLEIILMPHEINMINISYKD